MTQSTYTTPVELPVDPVPQTMRALVKFAQTFALLESGQAGKVVLTVEG